MASSKRVSLTSILLSCLVYSTFAMDYFPGGYFNPTDVTQVKWAHAVNSIALLDQNLQDKSIQMLEADLVIGTVSGGSQQAVIMAHPPATDSDLSFVSFLNKVMEHNDALPLEERKGVKLDFKEWTAAVMAIQLVLLPLNASDPSRLQFPIWINADILPGPVGASTDIKVDGINLTNLQKLDLSRSTLSLGWTTKFVEGNEGYTKEQVDAMAELIKSQYKTEDEKIEADVTFPLRAALALNSVDNIKYLLDEAGIEFASPSVTLWEGASDPKVTKEELEEFVEALGANRVFVDLPNSFPDDSGGGGSSCSINDSGSLKFAFISMFCVITALFGY